MAGKSSLSFSFSKKAEPKRVVEALVTKPDPEAAREIITGVESGQVTVDAPREAAKQLTIPCKNPLDVKERAPAKPAQPKDPATAPEPEAFDDSKGGLITRNLSKLSEEEGEAVKELLKDAANKEAGIEVVSSEVVIPILMREGSKKARDPKNAPDGTRDMFDNVAVEAFGEALLRGMGFDPTKHKTKPVFHGTQRDSKLGLGAKALLPHEKLPPAANKKKGAVAPVAVAEKTSEEIDAKQASDDAATVEQQEKRRRVDDGNGANAQPSFGGGGAASLEMVGDMWPSPGLVVRLINGDDARLKEFYGIEAVVLKVDNTSQCCRVKARIGGKTHELQDVRVVDLETRVSRDCESVRVVRGTRKGVVARLLQRDVKRNVARIQIEGEESELPLDSVCQFVA